MKQQITAHVFMSFEWTKNYISKEWSPEVWRCKVEETGERVYIGEQTVTVDVPDDFDPIPGQVAALEAEKKAALDNYHVAVRDINERLSKLLAITNEVEA